MMLHSDKRFEKMSERFYQSTKRIFKIDCCKLMIKSLKRKIIEAADDLPILRTRSTFDIS